MPERCRAGVALVGAGLVWVQAMRPLAALLFAAPLLLAFGCPPEPPAGVDAGLAPADGGAADASAADAGFVDAGSPDGGGPSDAAGADAGPADGGPVAPDPGCTANGCLRTVKFVGDFGKAQLQPYLEAGVVIDTGYSIYTVEYVTGERTSLATVTVPYPATAPAGGFHLGANAHGTIGLEDPCALTGTLYGTGLAGLFGARGIIGVSPDLPGLGTPGLHPYLVSQSEGRGALDALRAARNLALWKGLPVSGRAAVVGLSQGGHVALAAAAQHQGYAKEIDVRAFAAAAPASVWEEQWRVGVSFDGPHLTYHAMLMYSWASVYGYAGPGIWAGATAPTIDQTMTTSCLVPVPGSPTTLGDRLGTQAAQIFEPGFLAAYRAGTWGTTWAVFGEAFKANRIGPYPQTAPLAIWQGDADATVPESGTKAVVDALRSGGVVVDYRVVPSGQHADVAFGSVSQAQLRTEESMAWIRAQLDAP